uniref:Gnk2-homologous domain-containing protein n=1 Tax=Opuntia streptacantha TaxID=393608 RepID=A0A7C8YQY3_OPUST
MAIAILFVAFLLRIQSAMPASNQNFLGGSAMSYPDQPPNLNFKNNLENVLDTLVLRASKTGFSNSSFGESPDRAYGLYLCRGDLDTQACSDCVSYAKDTVLKEWQNFIEAEYRYDHCMLRYANRSVVGEMDENSWSTSFSNPRNGTWNRIWFAQVLNVTLNHLSVQTAHDSSGMRFATKVTKITRSESLYAMGQCTWDLTPSDCNKCLTKMVKKLTKCSYCSSGRAQSPNCNVRYETSPFFNGTAALTSSSLPSTAVTTLRGPHHEGAEVM